MDQILICGLRVHTRHGLTAQEKSIGQELEIDLVLDCELSRPCQSDCPEDAISRRDLIALLTACLSEGSCNLMERVAQNAADAVLEQYPQVERVEVLLKQEQAPIYADYDCLAVRIRRGRKEK